MVPHAGDRLVLRETDEADNPTGTYVFSEENAPSKRGGSGGPRVDVMVSVHFILSFHFRRDVGLKSEEGWHFDEHEILSYIASEMCWAIEMYSVEYPNCHMAPRPTIFRCRGLLAYHCADRLNACSASLLSLVPRIRSAVRI